MKYNQAIKYPCIVRYIILFNADVVDVIDHTYIPVKYSNEIKRI